MRVKRKTPARGADRGGRKIVQLGGTNNSENTVNHYNLQVLRLAFLARRHRLAPAFAAAVAGLAFTEEAMQ